LNFEAVGPALSILSNLTQLDLSKSINKLSQFPPWFANLTSLHELTIREVVLQNLTSEFFLPFENLQLIKIDMSQSVIESVEETAFLPLVHLKELILTSIVIETQYLENLLSGLQNSSLENMDLDGVFVINGHFYSVNMHMFRHLEESKIRKLNFRENYAGLQGRIHPKLFQPLKSLHELYLDQCDLVSVPAEAFKGLHHLKVLSLTGNLISCMRESDCRFMSSGFHLKELHSLDMSENLLSDADNLVQFKEVVFPQLSHLNLRTNKIKVISVGMFGILDKLITLDISDNPIEEIAANSFAGLTGLKKLNLENCPRLNRLKVGSFIGLDNLRVLNIQNSGVMHIHHALFNHMPHLEELYMKNNRLGESDETISKVTLRKSALRVLDMGGNKLSVVPKGLIVNGDRLKFVNLDNNHLQDCRQLQPLFGSDIEYLDISYNLFVEPSEECFRGMKNLVNINLAGNPFLCSCKLGSFTEWLTKQQIVIEQQSHYTCFAPDYRLRENVFHVSHSPWECSRTIIISLVICITVIFNVGIVSCLYRMKMSAATERSRANDKCEAMSEETPRCQNGFVTIESSTRYTALQEDEGSQVTEVIVHCNQTNGLHPTVANTAEHCPESITSNGKCFTPPPDEHERKTASNVSYRKSRYANGVVANGGGCHGNQLSASSRDSLAHLIVGDDENDCMSLTSDRDNLYKKEDQVEDSV